MTELTVVKPREGWGATTRRDAWWLGPLLVVLGLSAFLIYGTVAAWLGDGYEIRAVKGRDSFHADHNHAVAPYLSPFYSPLIYDPNGTSEHAWIKQDLGAKFGIPKWLPFSAGFLILAFPGLFRVTCYYYRKAYYRAFWQDPPACAVGEPRKTYWGENHWPLLFQNAHRYLLYCAIVFLVLLWWDALHAFVWPSAWDDQGRATAHEFGMGLGTLVMLANIVLLCGFTFGCNSLRHLVGGRLDCFSCANNVSQVRTGYKAWRLVTWFNERHALWAWLSLFSVGFTDVYIRMCSMGIWNDVRFF